MAVSPFALCTIGDVRQELALTETNLARDRYIERLIERASDQIETEAKRRFVAREYEEDYHGTGTNRLFLKNGPILSIATAWDDTDRDFDDATDHINMNSVLTVIEDAEAGIVRCWNEVGTFAKGLGNIRIRYAAGFAQRKVDWNHNRFDFQERSGGTTYTVRIPPGEYNVVSLGSKTSRTMASLGLNSYHVTYDWKTRCYNFALATGGTGTLSLLWNSGPSTPFSAATVFGFATAADRTGATKYTSSTPVIGRIPADIEDACIQIVAHRFERSPWGNDRRNVRSESFGDYSVSFFGESAPKSAVEAAQRYKWMNLE